MKCSLVSNIPAHWVSPAMEHVDSVLDHAADPVASTSTAALNAVTSVLAENGQHASEPVANGLDNNEQSTPGATTDTPTASEPTLSKSKQRKLARQERLAASKPERRAKERAAKKEKLAEKRRRVEEEGADPYEIGLAKKKKPRKGVSFNANVVIDLGFDDKMSEKDIKSMSTQLAHVYNVNRTAVHSVNVIFTPLEGQLKQRMVEGRKGDYLRWKGLQVYEKPILDLWSDNRATSAQVDVTENEAEASTSTQNDSETPPREPSIRKEDVIYLTADSKNVLQTLDEGKTYIVGGIVDHNKYKNLCLGVAQDLSIGHAALPISQYIDLATRKVLTVNQCFEIMSKWLEYRDWEKAFYDVIPKRKFEKVSESRPDSPALHVGDEEKMEDAKSDDDRQVKEEDHIIRVAEKPENGEAPVEVVTADP